MRITRLKSVEITGFRAFAEAVQFDVDADCVILVGANGRGKTSFFDAVLWALTGGIPRLSCENKEIVSLYSNTGEARVSIEFGNTEDKLARLTRSFDGEREHVRFQLDQQDLNGDVATARLLEVLWPEALVTSGSAAPLRSTITRSVYLQQDRVREFIEADDDQKRFTAVSELVGAGRVTELQAQLDRAKRKWSQATNQRRSELDKVSQRLDTLRVQLENLASPCDDDREVLDRWEEWWSKTLDLGVTQQPVRADSVGASDSLDSAMKEVQFLRRTQQKDVDLAREFLAAIEQRSLTKLPDEEALQNAVETARKALKEAREELATAENKASEKRRQQVTHRESSEDLRVLAELALRHLGERCPVCRQTYDTDSTRTYLEELMRGDVPTEVAPELTQQISLVAVQVEKLEEIERDAVRDLHEGQQAIQLHRVWISEQDRRLVELGIKATEREKIDDALRHKIKGLESNIELLERSESMGENLGLALTRATERTRRRELEKQVDSEKKRVQTESADIQSHNETGKLAGQILEGLREASAEIVTGKLKGIEPLLQRIYATVDPHPAFRAVRFLTSVIQGRGRLRTSVQDLAGNVNADRPMIVLSSSQLNALAVSVFLALNLGVPSLPMPVAMLDDPMQNLDDVNLLGLIDLLRRTAQMRQLMISTHDERFGELLERKLRPVSEVQRARVIEFGAWSRQGPLVTQYDVPKDIKPMRLAT